MFDNYTKLVIEGKEYWLAYTAQAMIRLNEDLKDREITEVILGNKREDFDAFCHILSVLSECGELARRYEGFADGIVLEENLLRACLGPLTLLEAKKAGIHAIMKGLGREIQDENEEYDVGLAELEKKTD